MSPYTSNSGHQLRRRDRASAASRCFNRSGWPARRLEGTPSCSPAGPDRTGIGWCLRHEHSIEIMCALPFSDNLVIAAEGRERSVGVNVNLEWIVGPLIGDELSKLVGRVEPLL